MERVHRNKQKAQRIIDAANTLRSRYGDVVPLSNGQLQRDFVGIGPQLGELLASVFAADWPTGPSNEQNTDVVTTELKEAAASRDQVPVPQHAHSGVDSATHTAKKSQDAVSPFQKQQTCSPQDNVPSDANPASDAGHVQCPVCDRSIAVNFVNEHLDKHFQ